MLVKDGPTGVGPIHFCHNHSNKPPRKPRGRIMKLRTLTAVAVAVAALMLAGCNSKPKPVAAAAVAATPAPTPPPPPPRGPAPDSIEYFNTVVGNMVHFEFDKYDVTA